MNRSYLIHHLRGPLFLVLTGLLFLLDQAHILSFGHGWPLYLILWGVLALAERAAIAQDDVPPPPPGYMAGFGAGSGYPGSGYPGSGYTGGPVPSSAPAATAGQATEPGTSIVPVHGDEITHRGPNDGGQS